MTPDDFDWRAEGQASSRALGLLIAGVCIFGLIAALLILVIGVLHVGLDIIGALIICASAAVVVWQVRGLVLDERDRRRNERRGRVQP